MKDKSILNTLKRFSAMCLGMVLLLSYQASANLVSFEFAGRFYSSYAGDYAFYNGLAFSGTFVLDTSTPPGPSPSPDIFPNAVQSSTFILDGMSLPTISGGDVHLFDNQYESDAMFINAGVVFPDLGTDGSQQYLGMEFRLFDNTQTAFNSGTQLPDILELSAFPDGARISISYADTTPNPFDPIVELFAPLTQLTTVTPVPVPGAMLLLLSGLFVIGAKAFRWPIGGK